jgi:hypothetical protein
MYNPNDLRERTKMFAIRIVRLFRFTNYKLQI